jgi:hypothetical protein
MAPYGAFVQERFDPNDRRFGVYEIYARSEKGVAPVMSVMASAVA